MSVEESDRIDLIATRPDSRVVRLGITDHLDWATPHEHCLLLQEKLNTYVSFVESGQLQRVAAPPIPDDPAVRIEVWAIFPLPPEAEEFYRKVRDVLEARGFAFQVSVNPQPNP